MLTRSLRHAKMPSTKARLASPEDLGSGMVLAVPLPLQPLTSVVPAKVFAFSANTQPSIVPASTPLPPAAADIVKAFPARMLPSKVIGPEPPTLIVALVPMIQKM